MYQALIAHNQKRYTNQPKFVLFKDFTQILAGIINKIAWGTARRRLRYVDMHPLFPVALSRSGLNVYVIPKSL